MASMLSPRSYPCTLVASACPPDTRRAAPSWVRRGRSPV